MAAARVESAATWTANVHRSCEPDRDERAAAQDRDQDGSVQKKILQLLRAFRVFALMSLPAFIPFPERTVKLDVLVDCL